MLVDKVVGMPRDKKPSWLLGRASKIISAQTSSDVPIFLTLDGEFERNASLLSSPPEFLILQKGTIFHNNITFEVERTGKMSASTGPLTSAPQHNIVYLIFE